MPSNSSNAIRGNPVPSIQIEEYKKLLSDKIKQIDDKETSIDINYYRIAFGAAGTSYGLYKGAQGTIEKSKIALDINVNEVMTKGTVNEVLEEGVPAKKAAETAETAAKEAAETAKEAAKTAEMAAKEAAETAETAAKEAAETAKKASKEAAETAKKAAETAEMAAKEVTEKVENLAAKLNIEPAKVGELLDSKIKYGELVKKTTSEAFEEAHNLAKNHAQEITSIEQKMIPTSTKFASIKEAAQKIGVDVKGIKELAKRKELLLGATKTKKMGFVVKAMNPFKPFGKVMQGKVPGTLGNVAIVAGTAVLGGAIGYGAGAYADNEHWFFKTEELKTIQEEAEKLSEQNQKAANTVKTKKENSKWGEAINKASANANEADKSIYEEVKLGKTFMDALETAGKLDTSSLRKKTGCPQIDALKEAQLEALELEIEQKEINKILDSHKNRFTPTPINSEKTTPPTYTNPSRPAPKRRSDALGATNPINTLKNASDPINDGNDNTLGLPRNNKDNGIC